MSWLELFHQIMPHGEVIYNQMHFQEINVFKVNEYIRDFKTAILEIRNTFSGEKIPQQLSIVTLYKPE